MKRSLVCVALAGLLAGCAPQRQLTIPPGVEPEIADAERLGRIMLLHDVQAAHATDEMMRIGVAPSPAAGVIGWITVPTQDGLMVRFVSDTPGDLVAAYDVTFSPLGVPTAHRNP